MNKEKFIKYLKILVLPAVIFLFVTFLFNKEITAGFDSQIERNDGRLLAWTLAWDNNKLITDPLKIFDAENGLFDANIYYPNDNTLTYSEHAFGISLISLPVYILSEGNPVVGFNFVILLCYFLNSFCAYLLIRYLTKSNQAGIIGGLIFGFCSFRVLNFGHLQNMPVFYMPLLILLLYKYFQNKKWRYLIGIGLCLLLQSLSSWYHMVFIFLLFGCFFLYFAYKKLITRIDLQKFVGVVGFVILVLLPFALPYFQFNSQNKSAYNINELKIYSADFGGYFLPSPNTFLNSQVVTKLNITKTNWQENFNFLGYIPILLSLLSFVKIKNSRPSLNLEFSKKKFIFIGVGLLFALLSFGPFLRLNDVTTRIPLLYYFVYYLLPPIRFIRGVARFSTVVFLMLGILAGFGYVKVLNKIGKKILRYLVTIVIGSLILFEYYPYLQFFKFEDVSKVPEIYTEVKNNSDIEAILELPIDVGPFETTGYIYWAGYHLKPIVNGYSGYEPPSYGFIKEILSDLDLDIALLKLIDIGVTHIVVNPTYDKTLESKYLELIRESEGYKLYRILDIENNLRIYINNFESEFNKGFDDINLKFENSAENSKSDGTPVANVSPMQVDEEGTFTFSAAQNFDILQVKFRAFTENDRVEIICGTKNQVFTNTEYLDDYFTLECSDSEFSIKLLSTEFKDRAFLKSIVLIDRK